MNQLEFIINGPVYNTAVSTTQNVVGGALGLVRLAVTGICLIALTILSIKYFMSTPTVKAESKSSLGTYIIGIVIFLGVTYFVPFFIEFIGSIFAQIIS